MQKLFELGPGGVVPDGTDNENVTEEQYLKLQTMMADKGLHVFIKDGWIWYFELVDDPRGEVPSVETDSFIIQEF